MKSLSLALWLPDQKKNVIHHAAARNWRRRPLHYESSHLRSSVIQDPYITTEMKVARKRIQNLQTAISRRALPRPEAATNSWDKYSKILVTKLLTRESICIWTIFRGLIRNVHNGLSAESKTYQCLANVQKWIDAIFSIDASGCGLVLCNLHSYRKNENRRSVTRWLSWESALWLRYSEYQHWNVLR